MSTNIYICAIILHVVMSLYNFVTQHYTKYFYRTIFAYFKIAPVNRIIKQEISNTWIYNQGISSNTEAELNRSISKEHDFMG